MKKIVYLCDLDQDIDDLIAVHYLHLKKRLAYVVLDKSTKNLERIKFLQKNNIRIKDSIEKNCRILFSGGALTKISEFLKKGNTFDLLVVQGGFAGTNVVDAPLNKFLKKQVCRTYNFNLDIQATKNVINSMKNIIFVSKDVCHSFLNTKEMMHSDDVFLQKYNLPSYKRLHDLLMVKEGLAILDSTKHACEYEKICFFNEGDKWGCKRGNDHFITVGFLESSKTYSPFEDSIEYHGRF